MLVVTYSMLNCMFVLKELISQHKLTNIALESLNCFDIFILHGYILYFKRGNDYVTSEQNRTASGKFQGKIIRSRQLAGKGRVEVLKLLIEQ